MINHHRGCTVDHLASQGKGLQLPEPVFTRGALAVESRFRSVAKHGLHEAIASHERGTRDRSNVEVIRLACTARGLERQALVVRTGALTSVVLLIQAARPG